MRLQNTLKNEIVINGMGLHTGRIINMKLKPAPEDSGITFIRTDRGNVKIKASVAAVSDTTFATTIASNGVRVGTIEHLLAAFSGLEIDNALIEIDGPEVPIMDGSSLPFILRIMESGISSQSRIMPFIKVLEPIVVIDGSCQIAITPNDDTRITYRLFYTHPAFGEQKLGMNITAMNFVEELAPARTFGFLRDIEMLKSKGLARGGSLDNAIVLGDTEVINRHSLRFKDEFVRHKILDAVGDLSLIGLPILGHIIANKSGHTLHVKLLRKMLICKNSWEVVSEPMPVPAVSEVAAQV